MQSAADFEKQYKEMYAEAWSNMLVYGTAFFKLAQNKQGEIEMTVVPIEDYHYLGETSGKTDSSL